MKTGHLILIGFTTVVVGLLSAGCASPGYNTSSYHPGPVAGRALGTGVGVVAGNAAGTAVGFTEGVVGGAAAPFDSTTRVVRRWHTETTPDGRTIQVPEDILVDAYGRPVNPQPAPQRPSSPQPTTNFGP